jgi:hypothetical protein
MISAAAVPPPKPECARPRAQQRVKASRHLTGKSASPVVHCCGRGRPHSAVIFVAAEGREAQTSILK